MSEVVVLALCLVGGVAVGTGVAMLLGALRAAAQAGRDEDLPEIF